MGNLAPPGAGAQGLVPAPTSDAKVRAGRRPLRLLDDTAVQARHILRASSTTAGAVEVLPGQWWAPAADGSLEGPQGWVGATVQRRVSDHGTLDQLVLPNAAGSDNRLHRDRFACRTDPRYMPGWEWIEFTDRASGRPLAVVTPDTPAVDSTSVTLSGVDAGGLLSGWREGKVAPWTPHAPGDVVDWYSQARQQLIVDDFRGSAGLRGWTSAAPGGTVTSTDGGLRLLASGANSYAGASKALATGRQRGWSVSVEFTVATSRSLLIFGPVVSGSPLWSVLLADTNTVIASSDGVAIVASISPLQPKDRQTVEVTAIDGWLIFGVNGHVMAQLRRNPTMAELTTVAVQGQGLSGTTDVTVARISCEVLRPMLRRNLPTGPWPPPDYRLAGAPPPGGLHGDYFLQANEWTKAAQGSSPFAIYGAQVLPPIPGDNQVYWNRTDPTIDFIGSPPTWQPVGPPNGEGFAVRWSGAIYIDPATNNDVFLRLANIDDMARLWIGKTLAADVFIDAWGGPAPGTVNGPMNLANWLGSTAGGWYPIVIEYAQGPSGGAGLTLQSRIGAGGAWSTVPASQLSPYGCWQGDAAGQSHRETIDAVGKATALQWRIAPKTLESGAFPGRLEYGARVGRDTDYTLGEDEATEYSSTVSAAETANRILADAAGLGKANGSDDGLTAEIVDPDAPSDPWVVTHYEQLQEISEDSLMRQRLDSLLALYSTPAETVAARPRGTDELTYDWADSFPVIGNARVLVWEPDDGIRLDLPTIGVLDQTPRRMTSVQWPLRPAGRGAPTAGFRQRPKHLRERLRTLSRQSTAQRQVYQGQLSVLPGTMGSNIASSAPDEYSRIYLPPGKVAKLELYVSVVSTGTIEVQGVNTSLAITRPGTYDVTAWAPVAGGYAFARLTPATGTRLLQLVATVRI